jgi:hypothetical protein
MPLDDSSLAGATEQRICAAIAARRLIRFVLHGHERIAEPHDYGVIGGSNRLFFYQVGGDSRSGNPLGWRWADLSAISDIEVLTRGFAGPRPTPTGRHVKWDSVIATVSPRSVAPRLRLVRGSSKDVPR